MTIFPSLFSDQVFGCNLSSLCQRENGTVPKFVKLCIEHVEEHGEEKICFSYVIQCYLKVHSENLFGSSDHVNICRFLYNPCIIV